MNSFPPSSDVEPDPHEPATDVDVAAASPSDALAPAPVQSVTTQQIRSQDAPASYGFISWFAYAALLFTPGTVFSIDSGLGSPSDILQSFLGYLILTAPFLAGYFLRSTRARLGCLGLILAGSVVMYFVVRALIDEVEASGEGMGAFVVIGVVGFWFAVVFSVIVGAVAGSVIRRVFRRRHAAEA